MNGYDNPPTQNSIDKVHKRQVLDRIKLCLMVSVIYLFLNLLQIGCPLKYLSGISCPGCGMTRAVWFALHLDFSTAFYYHPLYMAAPFMVLLFVFETYLNPKLIKVLWSVLLLLFLAIYLVRLFVTQNEVVEIDIWSGIVLKLLQQYNIVGGSK